MEKETNAQKGSLRRGAGVFIIMIFGIVALLDGFDFYNIQTEVVWSLGIVGLCLLITGLAKDVTSIIKKKIS